MKEVEEKMDWEALSAEKDKTIKDLQIRVIMTERTVIKLQDQILSMQYDALMN